MPFDNIRKIVGNIINWNDGRLRSGVVHRSALDAKSVRLYETYAHYTDCEKLDGSLIVFQSHATIGTEKASLPHALGRTPVGYIQVFSGNGGQAFKGTSGTQWTSSNVSFHSTVASCYTHVILF